MEATTTTTTTPNVTTKNGSCSTADPRCSSNDNVDTTASKSNNSTNSDNSTRDTASTESSVILFYKYHPLSSNKSIVEIYRLALWKLCSALQLTGRILVGCNKYRSEGINGTLAGCTENLQLFVQAMTSYKPPPSPSPSRPPPSPPQQQQSGKNNSNNNNSNRSNNVSVLNEQKPTTADSSSSVESYDKYHNRNHLINEFWSDCQIFYNKANTEDEKNDEEDDEEGGSCPPLIMKESEFKWSTNISQDNDEEEGGRGGPGPGPGPGPVLFPDLNIKITNELIGTGGVLAKIPLQEIGQGYLTPQEWHERMMKMIEVQKKKSKKNDGNNININENNNVPRNNGDDKEETQEEQEQDDTEETETIVIDCRNTKECQIGHFPNSVDPQTTTFNQFTQWVKDHKHRWVGSTGNSGGGGGSDDGSDDDDDDKKPSNPKKKKKKSILMYCTGGIRCEKASAFVRHELGDEIHEVRHLQGGIHKYLEAYPDPTQSLWQGRNFVFDNRGSHGLQVEQHHPTSRQDNNNNNNSQTAMATSHESTTTFLAGSNNTNATKDNSIVNVVVGRCRYCTAPYESFDPHCICTVCREPVLVCKDCQQLDDDRSNEDTLTTTKTNGPSSSSSSFHNIREFHCRAHEHLQDCYFTNIEQFSKKELEIQLDKLQSLIEEIAVGKKFKQRRKTLTKQCVKLQSRIVELTPSTTATTEVMTGKSTNSNSNSHNNIGFCTDDDVGGETNNSKSLKHRQLKCRNCGTMECNGKCWGFHSLKRKIVLDDIKHADYRSEEDRYRNQDYVSIGTEKDERLALAKKKKPNNTLNNSSANNQNSAYKLRKEQQRQQEAEELKRLGLLSAPNIGRDDSSGIRLPAPCIRTLRVSTKGKWCGQTLSSVLLNEFATEFKNVSRLEILLKSGLIFVNDRPIKTLDESDDVRLKNMDVISRVVYWQEPPVHIPNETIQVVKVSLPDDLFAAKEKESNKNSSRFLYVCNKPSTVPVHPAGPYLSNSLTMMVEAQEGLEPKSLIPCHRIDRVTSGLTICCNDVEVARLVQGTIGQSSSSTETLGGKGRAFVSKKYWARVHGRFPDISTSGEDTSLQSTALPYSTDLAKWKWVDESEGTMLKVDSPIETVDPANGIRKITSDGKSATSFFMLREYDTGTETSLVECYPKTGRSHQLRLHLQWLGHPIVNDVQYGGTGISSKDTTKIVEELFEELLNPSKTSVDGADGGHDPMIAASARNVHPLHSGRNRTSSSLSERLSSTFTKSQLLQGGHAICLHAVQYTLHFSMPKGTSSGSRETRTIELKVDLPPWAEDPKACV